MSERIRKLMEDVRDRVVGVEEAVDQLRDFPYSDLGYAKLDHHRSLRQRFPEVVFCQGKTVAQVAEIVERVVRVHGVALATRATPEMFQAVQQRVGSATYNVPARAITVGTSNAQGGAVLVISAGTADQGVAEEAAVTAATMGARVERLYDVGVAGLHRLLQHAHRFREANVLVVVAGMDGALPSVVGGLADQPVIAVPTSVGYGANLGGLAPLLAMLNSCAPGVTVVNIDNGFGAGYAAAVIARQSGRSLAHHVEGEEVERDDGEFTRG